jgi:hypothetical protein
MPPEVEAIIVRILAAPAGLLFDRLKNCRRVATRYDKIKELCDAISEGYSVNVVLIAIGRGPVLCRDSPPVQEVKRQLRRMALVEVVGVQIETEGAQQPDASEAEHDLLLQSIRFVATIEVMGELAVGSAMNDCDECPAFLVLDLETVGPAMSKPWLPA